LKKIKSAKSRLDQTGASRGNKDGSNRGSAAGRNFRKTKSQRAESVCNKRKITGPKRGFEWGIGKTS